LRAAAALPPAVAVLAASVLGTTVAYADLFGAHGPGWGRASLFAYASVLAFLVPAVIVLRNRWRRWLAHAAWARWPDAVIAAAGAGLACSATAHLIGEGGGLGLLAAVLAAAALAVAATRARS
jgi:hypothetical protein